MFSLLPGIKLLGQAELKGNAIFRDSVPLLIKSDLFAKSSPSRGVFSVVSPHIRITLATFRDYPIADAIIEQIDRKAKNLDSVRLLNIQFRLHYNEKPVTSWISLDRNIKVISLADW